MVESQEVPVIGFGLGSALYAPLLERTPLPMINMGQVLVNGVFLGFLFSPSSWWA